MRIFFLGDIVGKAGCSSIKQNLQTIIKEKQIDFVIVNGENAANEGLGITEQISKDLFQCGVDVITTGNHVWDQKETANHIEKEKRLLRPKIYLQPIQAKVLKFMNQKKDIKLVY